MIRAHTVIAAGMDELAPWRNQWDSLADVRGLPLAGYAWFRAAERHLAEANQVRVVYHLDAGGQLAAAAALESRVGADGHRDYQILGLPRLYEPSALLYRDNDAKRVLLCALTALRKPVILGRLWPEDADTDTDNHLQIDRHAIWLSKAAAPSQYLTLAKTYPDYIDSLPGQRRYDLRRAYKRAESVGPLTTEFRRPTPADLEPLLNQAMEIEARSWKGDIGCSLTANADLRGFFRDTLASYATTGNVFIAFLRIGTSAIATQVGLSAHGRLWLLKIGYDQAFRRLSPGLILMNESIKYSYNHGLRGLEFLGSSEHWVEAWRPSMRHYRLLAAYPHSIGNLLRLGRVAASRALRGLIKSEPSRSESVDAC